MFLHLSVGHSVHGGACVAGSMHGGGMHGGGCAWQGVCVVDGSMCGKGACVA